MSESVLCSDGKEAEWPWSHHKTALVPSETVNRLRQANTLERVMAHAELTLGQLRHLYSSGMSQQLRGRIAYRTAKRIQEMHMLEWLKEAEQDIATKNWHEGELACAFRRKTRAEVMQYLVDSGMKRTRARLKLRP